VRQCLIRSEVGHFHMVFHDVEVFRNVATVVRIIKVVSGTFFANIIQWKRSSISPMSNHFVDHPIQSASSDGHVDQVALGVFLESKEPGYSVYIGVSIQVMIYSLARYTSCSCFAGS